MQQCLPICYVVSHERSGTHFTIDTIQRNFPGLQAFHDIGEWSGPYDESTSRFAHLHVARQRFPGWSGVVKTHADYNLFKQEYSTAPVVYVVRDPRDVMVSWWHLLNHPMFYVHNPKVAPQGASTIGEFLRQPATPFMRHCYSLQGRFENVVERWCAHVAGWLGAGGPIHIVSYELLSAHFVRAVRELAGFLACAPPAKPVRPTMADGSGHLNRRAVVGDWRNYMSDADEAFVRATARRYGLEPLLIGE